MGQLTTIFLSIRPFSAWKQPTDQPGDPSRSLLLTSVRKQSFAIIPRKRVINKKWKYFWNGIDTKIIFSK